MSLRLVVLRRDYAKLEKDLLEVSALMGNLPELHRELEKFVVGGIPEPVLCRGAVDVHVRVSGADVIVGAYQDFEHELGERVGVPIEPAEEY